MGFDSAHAERSDVSDLVVRPSAPEAPRTALARAAAEGLGAARATALARAVVAGRPLSNRGVARTALLLRQSTPGTGAQTLQERARRGLAAPNTDWKGLAEEILAGIVDSEPGMRGKVDGVRYDPAAAQSDPTSSRRAVNLVNGVLVGGDILVRWVANGYLSDAAAEVRSALASRAQGAPPPTAATAVAGTRFRQEILKLANQIDAKGAVETAPQFDESGNLKPGTGGIGKWVDYYQLKADRAKMGAGFTSCGTVLNNIWTWAKQAAQKNNPQLKIDISNRGFNQHLSTIPGAWNPASENVKLRPAPGDAYYLQFMDKRTQSHVGTVKSITTDTNNPDQELWITADGGQRDAPGASDRVRERTRVYVPSKNIMLGGENADKEPRWLFGWTNVDALVS